LVFGRFHPFSANPPEMDENFRSILLFLPCFFHPFSFKPLKMDENRSETWQNFHPFSLISTKKDENF